MSADNYWYITKHPKGGWTYVMRFMSDDFGTVDISDAAPSFRTAWDAYIECQHNMDYVEYGTSFSPEAQENLGERKE